MEKLRMELDALRVESFDTGEVMARPGTVFGRQCPTYSCQGTCGASPPPSETDTTALEMAQAPRTRGGGFSDCFACCV